MVETPGWDDDPLERRALSLAALIRKVWRDITKSFVSSLAGKPTVALADTGKIRTDWGTQLGSVVLGHIRQTYMDGSNHIAQATSTDVDQQIGDDLVVAHLAEARNRLVGLGDDVWKAVRAQITLGTNAGESVSEIAKRIENVAGVSTKRSLTIARTETHMAYESGAHAQAMFVDPEAEKTWVATNDTRTRETHQAVDGQTIKINETFTVGGQALRFPGDPLGGAESINCRCTTTYEFGDIISPVSDGEMSDQELVLAAAGKKDWDASDHPRGADGKFIKKGTAGWLAVTSTTGEDVFVGIQAMKQSEWDKLTTQQQTDIVTKLVDADITAEQYAQATEKITALGEGTAGEKTGVGVSFIPGDKTTPSPAKTDAGGRGAVDAWLHHKHQGNIQIEAKKLNEAINELTQDKWNSLDDKEKKLFEKYSKMAADWGDLTATQQEKIKNFKKNQPKKSATKKAEKPVTSAPTSTKIPAGLKGKPGDPAKVTTGVIWGKHDPGTVVLEAPGQQVIWDGKKYQIAEVLPDGSQLTTANSGLTKKDAYAQLKNDTHWLVPGSLGYGDDDDDDTDLDFETSAPTSTSDKSAWQKQWEKGLITTDEFEAEFGESPVGVSSPPSPSPSPSQFSDVVDLSGLKKIGGQKGSNPGGTYEDPTFPGVSMYVKKAKSPKHAANEVAASALYNLAGVKTPQVFKATGVSGLGDLQTATTIVPNVQGTLSSKLSDQNFLKKIRDDFAVDAWLGNWDTVGLGFDNIVADAQGNPQRIDVGGALLFRAQGSPKGDKFGDEVIEIETLRNPSLNPQSAQIFGSMTDDEIRASVAKVAAISDADIDEIIKQSGLPKSVATTLKNRRDDLAKKYPPTTSVDTEQSTLIDLVSEFILDKDEFSAESAVELAAQMDKDTWDSLASDEKYALKQLLLNSMQSLYEDGFLSEGDAVSADLDKLKSFDAPSLPAKKVKTAPISLLDPTLTAEQAEHKNFLLGEAESGLLTQNEAVSLTNLLTIDDMSGMSKNQHNSIATQLEQAAANDLAAAKSALQKYKALKQQNTDMAEPWDVQTVSNDTSLTPLDENAFALIAEDGHSDTLITGDVVAVSDDGQKRITWSGSTQEFGIEEWNGTEWVEDLSTSYPLYDSDDNPISADLVFVDLLADYPENTWLTPTAAHLGPKLEVLNPPAYSHEDVIDYWPGVANDDVKPGTVIALSPDGKLQIMKSNTPDHDFYVLMTKSESGEWVGFKGAGKNTIGSIAAQSSDVWVVPPKTPAKPADLVDGSLPSKVVFESGLTSGKTGDVVAVGMIQDLDWAEYRLVVVPGDAANLTNVLKLEVRNKGANSNDWVYMSTYASHDDFINDWPASKFTWHKPAGTEPTAVDAPSAELPSTTPQAPAVAPPVTTTQPTVANGDDISKIPYYHKANFKKLLSANSATKVGYWSKPEKIWDKVKEIQAQYPDPNQPGGSKYTPLQILKSLDSLTNTKEPNPYETKITKWTATAKGSAYIAKDGPPTEITTTPDVPKVSVPETPSEIADAMWSKHKSTPYPFNEDTPLLSGEKNDTLYGVFAESSGFMLKYKVPFDNSGWHVYNSLTSKGALQDTIKTYNLKITPASGLAPTVSGPTHLTAEQLATGIFNNFDKMDVEYGDVLFEGTANNGTKWVAYADTDSKSVFLKYKKPGANQQLKFYTDVKTSGQFATMIDSFNLKPTGKVNPIFNTPVSKATAPKLQTGADTGLNMGDGDISHVSDPVKQDIYADFKKQPSTYLSSPEKSIFLALKQIGGDHNLNTLQALKIIDEVGAKKVNKPNQFLFEKKILDWLKTPKGAAVASGQPLPKPSRPAFKTGITPSIPSFEASSNFTYNTITTSQADTIQAEMHAKYGAWTTTEKSGLRAYTGGIYYSINSYLYGETDDISSTNENAMNNAQKGMRPSTQPMLLHRGVGWSGVGATSYSDLQKKVGQTWRNDGFSSTSVGGKAAFSHNPVLMEIEAPPGTPMAWVKPISLHSGENEMLLAAGTTYKILSVKQSGGQTVVRLRVVPEEENQ